MNKYFNYKFLKLFFLIVGIALLSHILYATLFNLNGKFLIQNIAETVIVKDSTDVSIKESRYESIDLKVVVNDKIIFNDYVRNDSNFGETINQDLKLGWNTVEVYSNKAKLYAMDHEFIFIGQEYHITFSSSTIGEYYNLTVHNSFF